jgi:hypothetical protein
MSSVITNIYNKKNRRTYLNGIVHSHRKTDFFGQLEMFDGYTTGDTTYIDTIFKFLCGENLNIVSMCAVSSMMHTSNICSCQKNNFSFPVAVYNSIKIDPLVFLL